jgi:hypothetical protein
VITPAEELEALFDMHTMHAPARPEGYVPTPCPPIPEDKSDEAMDAHIDAVRQWRVEIEVMWRMHFAVEMLSARKMVLPVALGTVVEDEK